MNNEKLSLKDSVKITKVNSLEVEVGEEAGLDEVQFELLKKAYKEIRGYEGKRINVRAIDRALSLVGNRDNSWTQDFLNKSFGGYVLSLRKVRLTEAEKKRAKQAKKGVGWMPVVGNKRVCLVSTDNYLALYVGEPSMVDGQGTFIGTRLTRVEYER